MQNTKNSHTSQSYSIKYEYILVYSSKYSYSVLITYTLLLNV